MVIWGEKGGMVFNTSFNNISVILWQSSGISDQQQKLKRVYPNIIVDELVYMCGSVSEKKLFLMVLDFRLASLVEVYSIIICA